MPAPSTEPNPPSAAPIGPVAGDATLTLDALPVASALCSADGRLLGSNARMRILLGSGAPDVPIPDALGLGPDDAQTLREALAHGGSTKPLHGGSGGWWTASIEVLPGDRRVLALLPADAQQQAEAEARRLAEWLEAAQDFGRLGVWERDLRTLQGRWDRHMHRFWGLPDDTGTPDRKSTRLNSSHHSISYAVFCLK